MNYSDRLMIGKDLKNKTFSDFLLYLIIKAALLCFDNQGSIFGKHVLDMISFANRRVFNAKRWDLVMNLAIVCQ